MEIKKLFFFFVNAYVITEGEHTILFDTGLLLPVAPRSPGECAVARPHHHKAVANIGGHLAHTSSHLRINRL